MESMELTRRDIGRLVYKWIGVDGGYLGSFSYTSHNRFWLEACDVPVDTKSFNGTTRECFEKTLFEVKAKDQAAALRIILNDYPPNDEPDPDHPKFRSPELHSEILAWISRLETGQVTVEVEIEGASEVVRPALDDADTLLRTSGPQSAVDRVHTAMHGYLYSLCQEIDIHLDWRRSFNSRSVTSTTTWALL